MKNSVCIPSTLYPLPSSLTLSHYTWCLYTFYPLLLLTLIILDVCIPSTLYSFSLSLYLMFVYLLLLLTLIILEICITSYSLSLYLIFVYPLLSLPLVTLDVCTPYPHITLDICIPSYSFSLYLMFVYIVARGFYGGYHWSPGKEEGQLTVLRITVNVDRIGTAYAQD